jgi:hypothetical protein
VNFFMAGLEPFCAGLIKASAQPFTQVMVVVSPVTFTSSSKAAASGCARATAHPHPISAEAIAAERHARLISAIGKVCAFD